MDIGKRIRQLRIQNDLTLEELASRTELTKGFLSQLERNLASPSIQTLGDITEALGTNMSKFFAEETEEQVIFTIIVDLEPKAKTEIIDPHEGEEFGYVLAGKIYLCRESQRKGLAVRKGENFYIRGNEAHFLENRADKPARVLWISTPPIF